MDKNILLHAQQKKEDYSCLITGDEILDGHVVESNMNVLIKALYSSGYRAREVRIVSDELGSLTESITELRNKYPFVVTIGGLGATHDDRTMEAYARSFKKKLILHQEMFEFFHRRPRHTKAMQDSVRKMSTMPEGTELIQFDDKWPIIKCENCFALPGLPAICVSTIEKLASVLPKQSETYYRECFVKIREHDYFTWLRSFSENWKDLSIGSYPLIERDTIMSKISITGKNKEKVEHCFTEITAYMRQNNALIDSNSSD